MVAFLEKSTGSEGFHQVIDFLSQSHISYALTKKPDIYISFIKQFWRTTEASTDTDGEVTITPIIDGQSKTITEASLRRHLKLEDHDGITSIPNSEIFEQLALMGYQPDSDKLTFQKGVFSPQWRFIQICLDMQKKLHKTHFKTYPVPSLNNKVFSNMRRLTKGYTGVEFGLFPTMLTLPPPEPSPTPSSSPSRITSSHSPSSKPSTAPTFEPQHSPDAEYHVPTTNESPLHAVHSHGSNEGCLKLNELTILVTKLSERIRFLEDDLKKTKHTYSSAFTKLILRIKKLEATVKTRKARKRERVVLSEDEEDDSSLNSTVEIFPPYTYDIGLWTKTAEASTDTDGEVTITAIIDGQSKTITEASLRRHLKLDDHDGITSIPNSEIFEQLALIGYQTDSDKLTFQKGVFSPQWRFLIHTLLHCLSPKKTAWEQFSSNIATALICLATNRKYNFSRLIFEHMVTNIGSPHKFLMYPSNMRRLTKGYTGVEIGLFPTMLTFPTPETSPTPSSLPSRITSSLSLSSEPSTAPTFKPQPLPNVEYHVPTPNESPLYAVHSHGSDEGSLKLNELTNLVTTLSERIGVLEDDLKMTKQTYNDEVVHDQDTAAERQPEDSTVGITVSTAPINISTARETHSTAGRVVYGRRSKEARKDKGKAIMTEPKPKKKSKKLLEQERLGLEEAIRLQEQVDEEERAQVARDKEIARQLLALDEERVTTNSKTTKDIDWNHPSVQKY
ncbi:hypothetical protein Tco_0842712 [Tanacetum coccineum]|uniref:Synaptobrevin, longin-like domain protein n=1 Tax=Tanacetum coccineum TaxID=301880 RepID=A0ABQ5B014_9ASTR